MPSPEEQLYNIVSDSLSRGNIGQAISVCRELNVKYPDYFHGWRVAGEIHLRMKKPEAVLVSTERALSLRPMDTSILLQRIDGLLALERTVEAKALLQSLAEKDSQDVDTYDRIGRLMASLEMHEESLSQYEKALMLEPENPALHYNVATAQRFLGMIEEAEITLGNTISLNAFDYEAQAMRSSLRKQTRDSNHVAELKQVLDDSRLPKQGRVNIYFALGKELDDLDDPSESFKYLKRGAEERRAAMSYEVDVDLEIMSAIQSSYKADILRTEVTGCESEEPIFIIGLPRTGTTLVERILSSHSAVHSAGELDNFGREMMKQMNESRDVKDLSRVEVVEHCTQLDFARLGRNYINSTRPQTGHTPRFIDKLPFNYLYVGLIHLALPKARIINLVRHPMAACYAIYKQLFRDAYPFSYDLEDLGRYYVAYYKLITHWLEVMPRVIHTIAYEDVVCDLEGEARKVIDYCGLDWQPACLNFHENIQASTTASAAQIRKPLYKTSIDRWRSYRDKLLPLERILTDAGVDTA